MSATWIPISDGAMAECPKCGETYVIDGHDGAEGFAKFCARNRYCHRCGAEITEEPKQTAWISTAAMLRQRGRRCLYGQARQRVRGISQEEREKMRRGEIDDPVRLDWSFVGELPRQYESRRSEVHEAADEWGNNHKPYNWQTQGRGQLYGQSVEWWMPLPPGPEPVREAETKQQTVDRARADCALSVILAAFALRPEKKKEEERADDTGDD